MDPFLSFTRVYSVARYAMENQAFWLIFALVLFVFGPLQNQSSILPRYRSARQTATSNKTTKKNEEIAVEEAPYSPWIPQPKNGEPAEHAANESDVKPDGQGESTADEVIRLFRTLNPELIDSRCAIAVSLPPRQGLRKTGLR